MTNRLRDLCARFCSDRVLHGYVEPTLADIAAEARLHQIAGRRWRERAALLCGCIALVKVLAVSTVVAPLDLLAHATDEERTALRSMVRIFVGIASIAILLLNVAVFRQYLTLFSGGVAVRQFLYLVPQALPIALPVALTLSVCVVVRDGSRSLCVAIIGLAFACSVVSFGCFGWLVPKSNDAFRRAVFNAASYGSYASANRNPVRGLNELTVFELRERISEITFDSQAPARQLRHAYYVRWALPWAPVAIVLLTLAVLTGRGGRKPDPRAVKLRVAIRLLVGVVTCGIYAFVFEMGLNLARFGDLAPALAAWLPNLLMLASALAFALAAPQRRRCAVRPA